MPRNVLVVTPLKAEYRHLYNALVALKLSAETDTLGILEVHRFPELNLTLARGGHGKTQFGIQTQYLLDHEPFDLVLCAGAAGALAPEVNVRDLIVATATVEHDYQVRFVKREKPRFPGDATSIGQIRALDLPGARFKIHFGIMAGGDEDVIEVKRGKELYKMHNALGVAWEGIGGARACAFSEVPYLELRGATDTADHTAPFVFDINLKAVMKNIARLLHAWLGG